MFWSLDYCRRRESHCHRHSRHGPNLKKLFKVFSKFQYLHLTVCSLQSLPFIPTFNNSSITLVMSHNYVRERERKKVKCRCSCLTALRLLTAVCLSKTWTQGVFNCSIALLPQSHSLFSLHFVYFVEGAHVWIRLNSLLQGKLPAHCPPHVVFLTTDPSSRTCNPSISGWQETSGFLQNFV